MSKWRDFVAYCYRKFRRSSEITLFQKLTVNGNLSVGNGSDVRSMGLSIHNLEKDFVNIEIGHNCIIEGTIILYNKYSRLRIGDRVFIGYGTKICVENEIVIDDDVMISWGCTIIDTNAHSLQFEERRNDVIDWAKGWKFKDWSKVVSSPIRISVGCWIGFNSIILKGVELGRETVVGAGSVVTKSFESYSILGGNPAAQVKKISKNDS